MGYKTKTSRTMSTLMKDGINTSEDVDIEIIQDSELTGAEVHVEGRIFSAEVFLATARLIEHLISQD